MQEKTTNLNNFQMHAMALLMTIMTVETSTMKNTAKH